MSITLNSNLDSRTMENSINILFVENLPEMNGKSISMLKDFGLSINPTQVTTLEELEKSVIQFNIDVVISDFNLLGFNAFQVLSIVKRLNQTIPVIIYTESMDEETAIQCMKAGAVDYVIKQHA